VIRVGFDVGGSKLAAIALDPTGRDRARVRRPVPRSYQQVLSSVQEIVAAFERAQGRAVGIGVAMPGVIGAGGEVLRAVNLPWLEGRPLRADLEAALGLPVAIANDADCFTLSEASDGAAAGAGVVFGAVLGTGVGGGIVVGGRLLAGANGVAGEWGHNPMPQLAARDGPTPLCACGRRGCIEAWLNGAALTRDYATQAGREASPQEIAALAEAGDGGARATLARYRHRLGAALGLVVNLLDPDVIVLGGGLSEIASLYEEVPGLWSGFTVVAEPATRLVKARFGPDSGLRGAARLAGPGAEAAG
jgi:fructokinase